MKLKAIFILFLIATKAFCFDLSTKPLAGVPIIYVDSAKTISGNGSTPTTAYKYLQEALAHASLLNVALEIRVAKGTYYPDEGTGQTNGDRNAHFKMLNNVKILGGYATGFQASKGRNWTIYKSILSGDINQNNNNKTYQIIKNNYSKTIPLTSSAILEGFIIQKSDGVPQHGGGIYNFFSSAQIQNCIFRDNRAYVGAAIENNFGSPKFENCLFNNNIASFGGNVMKNISTVVNIINCTIADNTYLNQVNTKSILSEDSEIIIKNSILWNNGTELADVTGADPNTYNITYTDINGGFPGTGNLNIDPLFKNPTIYDYTLKIHTPVYNKGNNNSTSLLVDLAGSSRFMYEQTDMGAYEYITGRIYVNTAASGANNGSTWADAYIYLIDALDSLAVTQTPGEVWVAQGVYHPYEVGYSVSSDFRSESFKMLNNVALYGGFLGYETSLNQRDWDLFTTVLSGDLQDNDITQNYTDNAYHVLFNNFTNLNTLTNTAILDGFTVFGGYAKSTGINSIGGGMYNNHASPTIRNCLFRANMAVSGAGMYNENSSPIISNSSFYQNIGDIAGGALIVAFGNPIITNTFFIENKVNTTNSNLASYAGAIQLSSCGGSLSNCTFSGNSSYFYGGAARIQNSTTAINTCTFTNNKAKSGGAVYMTSCTTNFTNCDFETNLSQNGPFLLQSIYHGGAAAIFGGDVNFEGCTFTGNWTENNGGGIYFSNTSSSVIKCTFINNLALYDNGDPNPVTPSGGAIFIEANADLSISNCLFDDNHSQTGGGAVYNKSNNASIINSLFINNEAYEGIGGAIENDGANPEISNCTFVDNNAEPFATIRNNNSSNPLIANSIIWGKGLLAISNFNSSTPMVENCIVKGGYIAGINIQNIDPKFKDSLSADYTLQWCSPAIDMGNNAFNTSGFDLNNNPRFFNAKQNSAAIIDLGPYESQVLFQSNCTCPNNLMVSGNTNTSTLRSSQSINSNAIILSGENVTLGTNNYIELIPPFETQSGTIFKAEMNGCSN